MAKVNQSDSQKTESSYHEKSSQRRRFAAGEKAKVLKRHFIEKQPISVICEDAHIQPSQFYDWQNLLFTNAECVFERQRRGPKPTDTGAARITQLEAKVREKDEVIAELMAEYLKIKKKTGENS